MDRNVWVLGVTQLNEYVRRQLAADPMLKLVRVRGEISGFKRHYSGHLYFSLKDAEARVQCVMFRQSAASLAFTPKDGMRVVVTANASLFPRDGAFQLYCEQMRSDGRGELFEKFEALKAKLEAEGLFDPSIKKPLPMFPKVIGVVTSKAGAALQDIIRVATRRNPGISILVASAAVQGEGAAEEIANALDLLNQNGSPDVILCGRGGGSIEELWAFNEEVVARAIHRSKIPVVSCVGHETDFTIADFIADVRAATPSMAAELAVPVLADLWYTLETIRQDMARAQSRRLELLRAKLSQLGASPVLRFPGQMLLAARHDQLNCLRQRLIAAGDAKMTAARNRLQLLNKALSGLNPRSVLGRGYALVERSGAIVSGVGGLRLGDDVKLVLRDGSAGAIINQLDMEDV